MLPLSTPESAPTVDLLIDWDQQRERRPLWQPALFSILVHLFIFIFFRTLPDLPVRQFSMPVPTNAEMKAKAMPLVLPPSF